MRKCFSQGPDLLLENNNVVVSTKELHWPYLCYCAFYNHLTKPSMLISYYLGIFKSEYSIFCRIEYWLGIFKISEIDIFPILGTNSLSNQWIFIIEYSYLWFFEYSCWIFQDEYSINRGLEYSIIVLRGIFQ